MPRLMSVLVFTLGCNLLPSRTIAQDAKQQPESQQSVPIRFHEVKFVSEEPLPPVADKIRAALQTLPPELDKDGMEELLARARDAWQHEGYLKVEVSNPEFKPAGADPNVIDATLQVTPGLQYKTGEITFRNNRLFTAAQLRSMIPIIRGEIFDTHKIGKGIEAIRRVYGEQGYVNFSMAPSTSIDDMRETVSIYADLDEGPQFHVRKFEIVGIDAEKAKKLIAGSGLTPGSVIDYGRLQEFFEKNTDVFPPAASTENCLAPSLDERAAVVDLMIDLTTCGAHKYY